MCDECVWWCVFVCGVFVLGGCVRVCECVCVCVCGVFVCLYVFVVCVS